LQPTSDRLLTNLPTESQLRKSTSKQSKLACERYRNTQVTKVGSAKL